MTAIIESDFAIVHEINEAIDEIIESDNVGKVTLMLSNGKEIAFDVSQRLRPGTVTDNLWEVEPGTGLFCLELLERGHFRKRKCYIRASEIVAFEVTGR